MITVLFIASLLMLVIGFLNLSAVGRVLLNIAELQIELTASVKETQFQSRVTRKMLRQDFDERIYPALNVKYPPEPSQLEIALADLEAGREPKIDFGQIGKRNG